MDVVEKVVQHVDEFQRRHHGLAFTYAVVKKYGEDQGGYQAALVTYYGFLSLFPLLLVLTTLGGILGRHHPAFGQKLVQSASNYFPVVGQQLDKSVHGLNAGGPTLLIGLLLTFYGTRGIADAFRHTVNHIWHIPLSKRSGFPNSLIRSLSLVIGGGLGLLLASAIAGSVSAAGRDWVLRILAVVLSAAVLYLTFVFILKMSLPLQISRRKLRLGAALSSFGLTVLQLVGGYVVTHESRHLTSSYSALFATTLGLMAWIYLQTQVIMYAIEVDTVRETDAWPRSLSGKNLTHADRVAQKLASDDI